jgi:DNA-binding response OmpR family regulator
MTVLAILSDRDPSRMLPALGDLQQDLKLEPLSSVAIDPVLRAEPVAVIVDAVENPGQAWAILGDLRARDRAMAVVVVVDRDHLGRFPWHEHADEFIYPGATEGELRIRLAMLRRRTEGTDPGVVRLGPLAIDTGSYRASVAGQPLDLTFKEFELLRFLAERPGRVSTRPALLREVWGYDFYGGTRTVDVHVRRLRAKLGPELEHLIETVRGVGYRAAEPE